MQRPTPTTSRGVYEYSTPWDAGYLYYRLELVQTGTKITGTFNAGNYLSKSAAGGYVGPDALATFNVSGSYPGKELTLMIDVVKNESLEEGSPNLLGEMNFPDLEGDDTRTIWTFNVAKGILLSQNGKINTDGTKTVLAWEKIH